MRKFTYDDDDPSKTKAPKISLEQFYDNVAHTTMDEEVALKYMTFAAKLALVSFKDQEEMLSFKNDFNAALAFIGKLDEIDVSDTQPHSLKITIDL